MKKLAIAQGEELSIDFSTYKNPAIYLKEAVEFLPDGQLISLDVNGYNTIQSYSQLWHRSTCILEGLRQKGFKPGEPVIFLLEDCKDFICGLWSSLMGGIVPLPLRFSSDYSNIEQFKVKLQDAANLLDNPLIITTEKIANSLQQFFRAETKSQVIYMEEIEVFPPCYDIYCSSPEELGALFLSSGTTGKPKLVSCNYQAIVNRFLENRPQNPHSMCCLYWLPLEHASSLLRIANPQVKQKIFLPTEVFLGDPLLWLDAIEKYQVNQTSITNFGMALINKSLASSPLRRWDLSSLKNIGIGAEAIMPKTYQDFLEALTPFGLNPEAVFTGYGLTECGTVVGGKLNFASNETVEGEKFVKLGSPCRGYSVRIVDDDEALLYEREIGNVQVMGPATSVGYYNKIQETQNLFTNDGWIKTGDLGFICDGELTITGRVKEIIIINAKNYSCQQIEQIVESLEGVEPSFSAACAIRNSESTTDELAVFFYTRVENRQIIKLINQIRTALITQLGITPTYLLPVSKEMIPRTTLGKIQRLKLAQQLEAGEFDSLRQRLNQLTQETFQLNFVAPQTETQKAIATIWLEVFPNHPTGIHDDFFELGGNSLLAAQVVSTISNRFNIKLALHSLFEYPTIAKLAEYVDTLDSSYSISPKALIALQPYGDKVPLYFINSTIEARSLLPLMDLAQPIYSLNMFGLTPLLENDLAQLQLKDIAEYMIQDLKTARLRGPYKLIGYCQNGALTLEIAQQLTNQGERVEVIYLIDSFFQIEKLRLLSHFKILYHKIKLYLDYKINKFSSTLKLSMNQKKSPIFELGKNLKNTNDESRVEKINKDNDLYEAYLKATATYQSKPYNGKIVSLISLEWSLKDQSKLKEIGGQNLTNHLLDGLHHHLFEEPFVQKLAKKLQDCLNEI